MNSPDSFDKRNVDRRTCSPLTLIRALMSLSRLETPLRVCSSIRASSSTMTRSPVVGIVSDAVLCERLRANSLMLSACLNPLVTHTVIGPDTYPSTPELFYKPKNFDTPAGCSDIKLLVEYV